MKTIFKVGDKVFDYQFGWGEVVAISGTDHPIRVIYDSIESGYFYSKDGEFRDKCINPTLSFTEYTLKGFSQERPELPEKGDVVWVRNFEIDPWEVAHFIEKQDHFYLVNPNNPYNESGVCYRFLTTVNPYKKRCKIA
jgi:histidinol-phosphate/aromatic aminotransferase/cobyric acid decarboxylase-like protein